MIRLRRIAFMASAHMDTEAWLQALDQEAPVCGDPIACAHCPARPGGEWEDGLQKTAPLQTLAGRWGCHASDRPCAGVIRLAQEATS